MAFIQTVRGIAPQIGEDCFLAVNATIVGDVVLGKGCSIWFNSVLRGDVNSIRIGNNVNIQDGSVLHTLYQKSTIEIGDNVSVGHNVTLHGCHIRDYALIGMGSVVGWMSRRRRRCYRSSRLGRLVQDHHRALYPVGWRTC